jgi:hypothetical protein
MIRRFARAQHRSDVDNRGEIEGRIDVRRVEHVIDP